MAWQNAFDNGPLYIQAYGAGHGSFAFGQLGKGQSATAHDNTDSATLTVTVSPTGDVSFSTTAVTLVSWRLSVQWAPPTVTGLTGRVSNASFAAGYTTANALNGDITLGTQIPFTSVSPALPNPLDFQLANAGTLNGLGVMGA